VTPGEGFPEASYADRNKEPRILCGYIQLLWTEGKTMMPIFDREAGLVGWFDGYHLFDLNMNWVAFLDNGNLFSSNTLAWLGPFHQGSFLDTSGKPVGWLEGSNPTGTLKPLKPLEPLRPLKPLKPLKPFKPLKPLKPLQPLGGWSDLEWEDWIKD